MIDDCSLGSIRSLIFISLLRKVPAGRWATPIPYGLRRRATASEMFADIFNSGPQVGHFVGERVLLFFAF